MVVPSIGRRFTLGLTRPAATCWALGAVSALLLTAPRFGLYSRYSAVVEAYAAVVLVSLVAYRLDVSMFKCLDVKALRLLGLSSRSYYVLHVATIPTALAIAAAFVPRTWSSTVPALVGCLVVAAWLLAIAPLTVCSFYLIEAPGNASALVVNLGRAVRLQRRRKRR